MNAPVLSHADWGFDELVREGISLIPAHAPDWTNHNLSDPGITLLELLAYFTEVLCYRLGRVTPRAKLQFLRLLHGPGWDGWKELLRRLDAPGGSEHTLSASASASDEIERELDRAVRELSHSGCAVTTADFERLAVEASRAVLGEQARVRALCLAGVPRQPGRQLSGEQPHVTVVLVPQRELAARDMERLCTQVRGRLAECSLLTTRLHVIGPVRLHAGIRCRLAMQPGSDRQQVLDAIDANLQSCFGDWHETHPPGAPVPLGKITEVIDRTPGVDFVEEVMVSNLSAQAERLFDVASRVGLLIGIHSTLHVDARLGPLPALGAERLLRDDAGRLTSIALAPWELIDLRLARDAVQSIGGSTAAESDRGR